MRKTKRERELEKQINTIRESYQAVFFAKGRLEGEAVRLQRDLDRALDEVRVLKATVRVIVLGCEFKETQDRPRGPYGAYSG